MENERIFTNNYFLSFSDLEDTHDKNDEYLSYFDTKSKKLIEKHVSEEDIEDIMVSRDLEERFNNGEDVSYELNQLYSKRGEPIIEDLSERLISLMDNPNVVLNNAKREIQEGLDL